MQITRATHRRICYSLLQTLWDPGESAGWLTEGGEGVVKAGKAFLLQTALGDSQVCVFRSFHVQIVCSAHAHGSFPNPQTPTLHTLHHNTQVPNSNPKPYTPTPEPQTLNPEP